MNNSEGPKNLQALRHSMISQANSFQCKSQILLPPRTHLKSELHVSPLHETYLCNGKRHLQPVSQQVTEDYKFNTAQKEGMRSLTGVSRLFLGLTLGPMILLKLVT